ncbi:MAG TPA: CBS domain-containing protein [Beijerinckiaceae bacterium]|nr:CBS domain-containing protein [Beijerinckiaceae bacterium]
MKIADVMTRDVRVISPDRSVRDAARLMDEINVGVLPVCDGRRLVGMLTDRDIAVRSTAAGIAPDRHRVAEIMTDDVEWCFEDDDVEEVIRRMGRMQIRRVPVVDRGKRLVGIVALGDLAEDRAPRYEEALRRISSPARPDRSGTPSTARADRTRGGGESRLTDDERRELEERRRRFERGEGRDRFGAGYGDFDDRERGGGFRFREEDDRRAAFPGSFSGADAGGEPGPGRMRGGYGGEGYNHYGARPGPESAGGPWGYVGGSGARQGHGSTRSGVPRSRGLSGEENYDRGMTSGLRYGDFGRDEREGAHRGRGPRGYSRPDERIREDVCERLADDDAVDASAVEVRVEGGEVTLAGTVASRDEKRRAEDLAERVSGVRHVQNDLRVGGNAEAGGGAAGEDAGSAASPRGGRRAGTTAKAQG